jgi:ribosomal protein L11 methyltransferase
MDYVEWNIETVPKDPWSEVLIAYLADAGFESFVENDKGFQAYAQKVNSIDFESLIDEISDKAEAGNCQMTLEQKIIPHQNWNAIWEADFEPVIVEDYVSILAPFHDKSIAKGMIVEIQPQMSFGTGHHQTTFMMSKALFELDKIPSSVLDMGTGTGILAIIAEKLGAKDILAIDIEEWSAKNAAENAKRNNCTKIQCLHGDIDLVNGHKFGLILANINKNVLKGQIPHYAKAMLPDTEGKKGILFLSGFFSTDVDELVDFAKNYGFVKRKIYSKDNWAAIVLEFNS